MSSVVLDVNASQAAAAALLGGDGSDVRGKSGDDADAVIIHTSPRRMLPKGTLTLMQMLLLNAVVCGVEIVACAGFTYIPPMLLKAGYSEENMGFLLGLGPLFGFLFVPVIGRASDRCYSPFGRRRPFILGLSLFLVVALYLIPFGEYFASLIVGVGPSARHLGILALTVGVVLLDFTTQACLTPCEALLNDASKNSDQNEKIFTIYSLMISSGGILGYLLTAIDWTQTSVGGYFGGQEASIFSILIIVFTMMLGATLFVAKEKPLMPASYDIATVRTFDPKSLPPSSPALSIDNGNGSIPQIESGYDSSSEDTLSLLEHPPPSPPPTKPNNQQTELLDSPRNKNSSIRRQQQEELNRKRRTPKILARYLTALSRFIPFWPYSSPVPKAGMTSADSVEYSGWVGWLVRQGWKFVPRQLIELFQIPAVLRLLAVADFCSWTAIMGFNIYFTDYVGQVVYGGNPNALESSPESQAYDDGVRNASWGLLLHCICSAGFSFFIERLTSVYGYKTTFTLGMVTFVFCMMGMVLIRHIYVVNLCAAATGFAYSTITTIPFMLLSKYHADKEIYFADLPASALIDPDSGLERGIGADMAVLDWAYFLSQVALTTAMGTIVHFTGSLVSYMVTAGAMGVLAIYYIGRIVENEVQARRCILDEKI